MEAEQELTLPVVSLTRVQSDELRTASRNFIENCSAYGLKLNTTYSSPHGTVSMVTNTLENRPS